MNEHPNSIAVTILCMLGLISALLTGRLAVFLALRKMEVACFRGNAFARNGCIDLCPNAGSGQSVTFGISQGIFSVALFSGVGAPGACSSRWSDQSGPGRYRPGAQYAALRGWPPWQHKSLPALHLSTPGSWGQCRCGPVHKQHAMILKYPPGGLDTSRLQQTRAQLQGRLGQASTEGDASSQVFVLPEHAA